MLGNFPRYLGVHYDAGGPKWYCINGTYRNSIDCCYFLAVWIFLESWHRDVGSIIFLPCCKIVSSSIFGWISVVDSTELNVEIYFMKLCSILRIGYLKFCGEPLIPGKSAVGNKSGNLEINSSWACKITASESFHGWIAFVYREREEIYKVFILRNNAKGTIIIWKFKSKIKIECFCWVLVYDSRR